MVVVAGLALYVAVAGGCAHHSARVQKARDSFLTGELSVADAQYAKLMDDERAQQELLLADRALVNLFQGDVDQAEAMLRSARDGFDRLDGRDFREETLSMLSDDRQRAYAGEDYERILIRNILAITNLMNGGADALAYCRQANAEQEKIIADGVGGDYDNPKESYRRVPVAAYLYGVIREATHAHYDDAQRAYETVASWQPQFQAVRHDVVRVRHASHSQRGNGVVYVIGFVGPGPFKREATATATSNALMIASQLVSVAGDDDVSPLSAPVKIPEIVVPSSPVTTLQVVAGGQLIQQTETICDVGTLAYEQWQATRDFTIARAITRRLAKKTAVYAAKRNLLQQRDDTWVSLALDATGFLWEASESVDTRSWSTLPGTIQIARCELPAGQHRLALRPVDAMTGESRSEYPFEINVRDGRNTYVLSYFPSNQLVGRILVSDEH